MVAHTRPMDAETFSYKILRTLEGPPSRWKDGTVSETRRFEAARLLEAWYSAHGTAPDTPKAYAALDDLIPSVAKLYSADKPSMFDQRAATIGDTIYDLVAKPGPSPLDIALQSGKDAKENTVAQAQNAGLLKRIANTAMNTLENERRWYKSKAPGIVRATEKGAEIGQQVVAKTSETAKKVWRDEVDYYEKNGKTIKRNARTALMVGAGMGALHMQRVQRLEDMKERIEIGYDDVAMTRWAAQYANYFHGQMNEHLETGFSEQAVSHRGGHVVGYGSEIDSKAARQLLKALRIDRQQLLDGKIRLTENEAELLLHAEAERFANRAERLSHTNKMTVIGTVHAGNELLIAQIDGLPDQGVGQAKDAISYHKALAQYTAKTEASKPSSPVPYPISFSETSAKPQGKTTESSKPKPHAAETAKSAKTKQSKPHHLKAHTKQLNVEFGLSPNPNAYMSRPMAVKILKALEGVPQHRDYGNPNDPASQKFYSVEAIGIAAAEGLSAHMYKCEAGHPTIGYGCNLDDAANRQLITKLFHGKYDPQAMREGRQDFDLGDAKTLLFHMLATKELETIAQTGGLKYYQRHSVNLQFVANDLYFNGPATIGPKFRAAWKAGDDKKLVHMIGEDTNKNDSVGLGHRRDFSVVVATGNLKHLAGPKQSARIIHHALKKEAKRIDAKTQEILIPLETPKIDPLLTRRLEASDFLKKLLERGKDITIATERDTATAQLNADGNVGWVHSLAKEAQAEEERRNQTDGPAGMMP